MQQAPGQSLTGNTVCIEDCYGSFDDQAAPALAHSMSEISFKRLESGGGGLMRGESMLGPERATRAQTLGQGLTHNNRSTWGRQQSGWV